MSDTFQYDVFLSHSAKDKDIVRPLAERLRADGLRVWFEEWEIPPAVPLAQRMGEGSGVRAAKIESGLEHSRVLVLCLSANALGSDWAQLESGTFRFRDPLNTERRFIPLRLDATPAKGSLGQFAFLQWYPAEQEQEYPKLREACRPPAPPPPAVPETAREAGADKVVQLDTKGFLRAFTFSPDGKHALTGANDNTVRLWEVATGRCERVLEGHTATVWGVAWSPDGRWVLSAAEDKTVRLWEVATGRCERVLEGHTNIVLSVAWSPDGRQALSGGIDRTVRLWEVATGRCERVLEGHTGVVWSVAWSPDGRQALSGSWDNTVRLWEVATGRCERVLEGHTNYVWSVAWSSGGRRALSGAADNTVRLWDVATGRCEQVLAGHTNQVWSVAWSPDGRRALSGAADNTVRLWDVAEPVAEARTRGTTPPTVTSAPEQVQYTNAKVLLVGDTGVGKSGMAERLVNQRFIPTVSSHARKAHLLESCVVQDPGGIALHRETLLWDLAGQPAYRLVHQLSMEDAAVACVLFDCRNETNPFEGAAYWSQVLDQARTNTKVKKILVASRMDVGGLPASRERIEEFARTNGFAQFIATSAYTGEGCDKLRDLIRQGIPWEEIPKVTTTKVLAALREYVGKLKGETKPAGPEVGRVSPLRAAGVSEPSGGALRTDAPYPAADAAGAAATVGDPGLVQSKGEIKPAGPEVGRVSPLRAAGVSERSGGALRTDAPYPALGFADAPASSKVSATLAAAQGREEVANGNGNLPLFTVAALHEGFCADFGAKIPWPEFVAHLQRLEATDALDVLLFHTTGAAARPETQVLLDPTRVDAYASALLVAAKDEPDGPGHLLESRVRAGNFKLTAEERLGDAEAEGHVLWFVLENLLARDLALRETIKGEEYIVFPSQCTAELRFPGVAAFGVAYGFAGPVRSIYATLIAQLAHYEGFKKREFFHDAAAYRAEAGGRCLVRLQDQGRGKGELVVSFEGDTPPNVRQGFLEFVGKHLEGKSTPGSVTKRHAYQCANAECRKPYDDAVVKARLEARKKQLVCPYCEQKTPLVDLLAAPTVAAAAVATQMGKDAKAGRQRMTAALVIKAKEAEGKFDVFLSHNSKDKGAVEKIAKQLLKVGIRPWLDKWNLVPGETVMDALEKAIKTMPCATLCFGPADTGRWHIMEIRAYVEKWASGEARMIPVILPGVKEAPELPLFVRQTLWVDLRDWENDESDGFYRLVCGILGKAPGDSPRRKFSVRDVAEWQGADW